MISIRFTITFAILVGMSLSSAGCCHDKSLYERLDRMEREIGDLRVHQQLAGATQIELPANVLQILQRHVHRDEKGEVTTGTLARSDFTPEERRAIDSLLNTPQRANPNLHQSTVLKTFDEVIVLGCGDCTTSGGSKGYRLYIPSAGIYACASCGS